MVGEKNNKMWENIMGLILFASNSHFLKHYNNKIVSTYVMQHKNYSRYLQKRFNTSNLVLKSFESIGNQLWDTSRFQIH